MADERGPAQRPPGEPVTPPGRAGRYDEVVHSLRGTAATIKAAAQLLQRRDDLGAEDRTQLVEMVERSAETILRVLAGVRPGDVAWAPGDEDARQEVTFTVLVRGARPPAAVIEHALEVVLDDAVIDVREHGSADVEAVRVRRRKADV